MLSCNRVNRPRDLCGANLAIRLSTTKAISGLVPLTECEAISCPNLKSNFSKGFAPLEAFEILRQNTCHNRIHADDFLLA
jgi:hypothetical protein